MNKFITMLLTLLLLVALPGCADHSATADKNTDQLLVYTSVFPLYDFTYAVAGNRAQVILLGDGGEPHDWEPTPGDMAGLENADLLIYNGAGLEHWVDTVLSSLRNETLIVVEASAGITLLSAEEEDHGDHRHDGSDPHVWLSPVNAQLQVETIADALSLADPDGADYYQDNARRYCSELETLHDEFREALAPFAGGEIVVAHQAFGYLCHEYNLHQIAVSGLSPEGDPDLVALAGVIDLVRSHNVKVIFFEQAAAPGLAETIAAETGARTNILSPLERQSTLEKQAGDGYLPIMRRNLQALVDALGEQ